MATSTGSRPDQQGSKHHRGNRRRRRRKRPSSSARRLPSGRRGRRRSKSRNRQQKLRTLGIECVDARSSTRPRAPQRLRAAHNEKRRSVLGRRADFCCQDVLVDVG
ncbi:unnamed protein product [Amoebophrya sp. A120]|nr:unnamed protein product [Amoebophrya sp. A120]|eukprot:GSA120T00024387001.1